MKTCEGLGNYCRVFVEDPLDAQPCESRLHCSALDVFPYQEL